MRSIITGSVKGQFPTVFAKLSKLHVQKSFSLAIILGDLFADATETSAEDEKNVKSLVEGGISIPLPTYFTLGSRPLPPLVIEKLEKTENEVCPNLYFLNKRSTTKTSEGLRIVTLGGSLDPAVTAGLSKERFLPFHTEGDAHALRGSKSADILITSHWPLSIRSGSRVKSPDQLTNQLEEQCVADLCSALRPRYHFTTSDETFYEREPFLHLSDQSQPETRFVTRFISLAAFDNPYKQKWLYAFSIDPTTVSPSIIPPGITASPLIDSKKRPLLPEGESSYSRFAQSPSNAQEHPKKRLRRQPPPTPRECFFCLANPNVATHLITSIANESYLATAKGPLTNSSTFSSLRYPAHILIVPLAHSPTLRTIPDPECRTSTVMEMHRYRRALQSYLSHSSKNVPLGAVTWELSRAAGIHIHWQFLPVAAELVEKGLVAAAFRVEAENERYAAFHASTPSSDSTGTSSEGDYFRLWIWRPNAPLLAPNGTKEAADSAISPLAVAPSPVSREASGIEISLTLPIPPNARFDAQFGRRVMAKLLRLETRIDWRDCGQEVEDERRDAEAFKKAFRPWDFAFDV
ncbi:hypothetical protein MMC07_009656 [Pseudocyphellaria aurata]|nr:hypothetical protein [Pseudocyphellaria aurata]